MGFSYIKFLYLFLAICIGISIKFFYSSASVEQLLFILFPVQVLIQLQTGYESIFTPEKGYVFPALNICIDKSCAGLNFLTICFLSCAYIVIKKIKEHKDLPFILPVLLIISFFTTILANTSRILIALLSLRGLPNLARQTWFHETQGAFVFISTLLLCYFSIYYFIGFMQKKS